MLLTHNVNDILRLFGTLHDYKARNTQRVIVTIVSFVNEATNLVECTLVANFFDDRFFADETLGIQIVANDHDSVIWWLTSHCTWIEVKFLHCHFIVVEWKMLIFKQIDFFCIIFSKHEIDLMSSFVHLSKWVQKA